MVEVALAFGREVDGASDCGRLGSDLDDGDGWCWLDEFGEGESGGEAGDACAGY